MEQDEEVYDGDEQESQYPALGQIGPVDGTNGNVYLVPGDHIFKWRRVKAGKGKDANYKWEQNTTHSWCPEVEGWIMVPDATYDRRKVYMVRVGNEVHEVYDGELADGSAWSYFTDAKGTKGSANLSVLGNIVEYLAGFHEPTRGYAFIGWQKVGEKYVYILEDGRGLDGTRYYVLDTDKEIADIGVERMPSLPLRGASLSDANGLLEWMYRASPKGHAIIQAAAMFRSYLDDIVPSYTSNVLVSKVHGREASRLGKTTIQKAACNWSFRTRYNDRPHATFRGTPGSVEKAISRQRSGNCVIDDLNVSPTSTEKDIRDVVNILEMVVRTTANHAEARTRLKRNLTKAASNMFYLLPSINGELMPPVLASLERRMISTTIVAGDVDIEAYKADWETHYADIMLRVGHMALRKLQHYRNVDNVKLRHEIDQQERQFEQKLRNGLAEMLSNSLSQLCMDLPILYSRLMTGIWAVGRYAYSASVGEQWANDMYPYVLTFMIDQINRLEGSKASDDEGSIGSLIHIMRDEIALQKRIDGQFWRIADKNGEKPGIEGIDPGMWGNYDTDEEGYYVAKIIAYIGLDKTSGKLVLLPTSIFMDELIGKARRLEEYKMYKTKNLISEALEKEGWLVRTDGVHREVHVSVKGLGNPRFLLLNFNFYEGSFSGKGGKVGKEAEDQPVEPDEGALGAFPPDWESGKGGKAQQNGHIEVKRAIDAVPTCPKCDKSDRVIPEHDDWACLRCIHSFDNQGKEIAV